MQRSSWLLLLLALVGGGWLFFVNFQLEGLDQISLRRRAVAPTSAADQAARSDASTGEHIRIASFHVRAFGAKKTDKPPVIEVLVETVRRFDIVAIQGIRGDNRRLVAALVDRVNDNGRRYDFLIGAPAGRTQAKEQAAFLFDSTTVQVDRLACYTVVDPQGLFERPPLVGSFRVRQVAPERAFTFTLINVHTNPNDVGTELDALAAVYRQVRRARRGEDDIILLGDLNANERQLAGLGRIPGIRCAISRASTHTPGTRQYDNILFSSPATTEFTGRAGLFDVMREFNLTTQQTLEISDHLPVWAEFSAHETAALGPIAGRPDVTASQ